MLKLDWCSHEAALFSVQRWHYSRCLPAGKLVKIGVWEKGKFIGCVLFSRGANNCLGIPYGLTQDRVCELTRIALTKHVTPVTRIISIALKMLRKLCPALRLVISFADTEQGHHGGIYQAGGWLYAGLSNAADEYFVKGVRMHGRSMRALYGTHIGKDFIVKTKGSRKHRYLMPLDNEMKAVCARFVVANKPKRVVGVESTHLPIQAEEGGAVPTTTLHSQEAHG